MSNAQLTDVAIRKAVATPGRQFELWDAKIKGFGVRISPSGTKSFVLLFRAQRRSRRLTLGRYPALSLSDARKLAQEALNNVAHGGDPVSEKKAARKGPANYDFESFVTYYIDTYAKRTNRQWAETERLLQKEFVPHLGTRDIRDITRTDVVAILDGVVLRGRNATANRVLAAVRKLFNWAVERGVLESSPILGLSAPCKEISRDRVLDDRELVAIWQAAGVMGYPFGSIVKLLILTGQRISEVSGMRWDEIDDQKGLWSLSTDRTKSKRAHVVPLAHEALKIVAQIKNAAHLHETLIFPARKLGSNNPVSGFGKWKRQLDDQSGAANWRLHDLRRTAATGMARLEVPPHVVERILNHTSGTFGGVAGIYNRFGYLPEMREALAVWERHVVQVVSERL